ncbi:hypothetical protein KSF78_0009473 [Schistosoma japonicum]|nr:hypothetical protein KSF78_0009473 [Schistosoma japonicum]
MSIQMKKEYEKKSKPSILEYLPKCGVTVDLYCPEEMSIDQLLEIFERRDASNHNVNCSIQINNTKEIINQSVVNKVSNENIIQNTSLNHSHSNDNTIQPIKKRSKIDRNFSILANNV